MTAQFVVGIDLGTTNSVLSYAALDADDADIRVLDVPQIVDAGTVDARGSLSSFLYLATKPEVESNAFDTPWASGRDFAVGDFARRQAADVPDRTVGAAKSWLCHSKVDRHQAILPWKAPDSVAKVSPVTASRRNLEHLVAAWEHQFPDAPLSDQQVVLTVPASFDASARELTHEAALAAGLPDSLVLLEEPLAAVYAWLVDAGDGWRKEMSVGDMLLVCDVGGGTTDLTLVEAVDENGDLFLSRKAVGRHLLVGGDNMDLALAYRVSELFADKGTKLDPWQSVSLWHSCRAAKESLLAEDGADTHTISVLGRGSRLVGGTVSVDVKRKLAVDLLVDGFFPKCSLQDKPARERQSGFQEIGLPYEADTAVTKHLADFLARNADDGEDAVKPTHVLFNGGVFKGDVLRIALLDRLADWFGLNAPQLLDSDENPDNAVARGAAWYGWAKQHGGVRIRGGTARSYYVGIETAGLAIPGAARPLNALCVVPRGMEEGTEADVPSDDIGLVVGESARFRFFSSSDRADDEPGTVLQSWDDGELEETDSLEATLDVDEDVDEDYVPVRFHSSVTELGLLELWCVNEKLDQRWKLEFSVRDAHSDT